MPLLILLVAALPLLRGSRPRDMRDASVTVCVERVRPTGARTPDASWKKTLSWKDAFVNRRGLGSLSVIRRHCTTDDRTMFPWRSVVRNRDRGDCPLCVPARGRTSTWRRDRMRLTRRRFPRLRVGSSHNGAQDRDCSSSARRSTSSSSSLRTSQQVSCASFLNTLSERNPRTSRLPLAISVGSRRWNARRCN